MRDAIDAEHIELLTFDCYGTLIDWLGGVRAALHGLPSVAGCDLERLVRDRDEIDRDVVLRPYAPYGEQLAESLREAARRQGREIADRDLAAFVASMPAWPPFAESGPCLRRLARRYELAILSNVERRVLEASVAMLGAPFAFLVTAEEVRSYKPARAHFDEALRRSGVARERVLHVACSLFHDVRPALALGWQVAWINREREVARADEPPQLEVPNLAALCEALRC
jgi:2-haloalkanoic acid dehalogenase type II